VKVRSAAGPTLDAATLYALLRLRSEVFVLEQASPYGDPDGRDLDEGTVHWWAEDGDGRVAALLRVLPEPGGGSRIGRVATAPGARGQGLASSLLRQALAAAPRPVVLDAQARQTGWYAAFGFTVCGEEFDDAGIAHVPMRLD
jgi:ElaA protein